MKSHEISPWNTTKSIQSRLTTSGRAWEVPEAAEASRLAELLDHASAVDGGNSAAASWMNHLMAQLMGFKMHQLRGIF